MLGVQHITCFITGHFLAGCARAQLEKKFCFDFLGYLHNLIPRNTEIPPVKPDEKVSTKF